MQRVQEALLDADNISSGRSRRWLTTALFAENQSGCRVEAVSGQFFPGSAGGPNNTCGFEGKSSTNPWDFVFLMEGSLVFAAAAVRRLQAGEASAAAFPFFVQQAGVGYPTASLADELAPTPKKPSGSKGEVWLPIWKRPAGLTELLAIFGEGRVEVGRRAARTGTDFARALVGLGVDRGLCAFERTGFQTRNGRSVFATPLGRFAVHRNARADLLSEADRWLDNFRRIAGPSNDQVPGGITRALNQLENRILDLCQEGTSPRLQAVLIALGQAEKALARSLAWTTGRNDKPPRQKIAPLAGLSGRWLRDADDGSTEFRLAAALASVSGIYKDKDGRPTPLPVRCHLEPAALRAAQDHRWFAWDDPPSNDVVWHEGDFVEVLNAIFDRRLIRAQQAGYSVLPDRALSAALDDIVAFLEGQTDDARLADLLWGFSLLDWSQIRSADFQSAVSRVSNPPPLEGSSTPPTGTRRCLPAPGEAGQAGGRLVTCATAQVPSALFSLLRLAFLRPGERGDFPEVPAIPMIHRHAAAGHGLEASRLAARRLRGSGFRPALNEVAVSGETARRAAAALLFPLSCRDSARLGGLVLKAQTENQANP